MREIKKAGLAMGVIRESNVDHMVVRVGGIMLGVGDVDEVVVCVGGCQVGKVNLGSSLYPTRTIVI